VNQIKPNLWHSPLKSQSRRKSVEVLFITFGSGNQLIIGTTAT
jgi:hypothetical protein